MIKMKKKNQSLDNRLRKNPYIVSTFVLLLLVVILITGNIIENRNEILTENEILCSAISATPAWAIDGKLKYYGIIISKNVSIDLVNNALIPQRMKFLYNPSCSACKRQIDYFKEQGTWEVYQKTGLTVDCSEVMMK